MAPKPLHYLSASIDACLATGGLAMIVIVFVNATLRGAAGFDLAWSLEVTGFLLLWLTFLGCAAAMARRAHMRVTEIVAALFPSHWRRLLALLIDLAVAVLLIVLIVVGIDIARHTWAQQTTVLYWPVGLGYAAMPAGMTLTLIFHLHNIYLSVRGRVPAFDHAADDGAETRESGR